MRQRELIKLSDTITDQLINIEANKGMLDILVLGLANSTSNNSIQHINQSIRRIKDDLVTVNDLLTNLRKSLDQYETNSNKSINSNTMFIKEQLEQIQLYNDRINLINTAIAEAETEIEEHKKIAIVTGNSSNYSNPVSALESAPTAAELAAKPIAKT